MGLDIIFIDGDQSAEGCYADIRGWRRHLAPGGRMLGHDAAPDGGVRRALERYRAEAGVSYTIHEPPAAFYVWELNP